MIAAGLLIAAAAAGSTILTIVGEIEPGALVPTRIVSIAIDQYVIVTWPA